MCRICHDKRTGVYHGMGRNPSAKMHCTSSCHNFHHDRMRDFECRDCGAKTIHEKVSSTAFHDVWRCQSPHHGKTIHSTAVSRVVPAHIHVPVPTPIPSWSLNPAGPIFVVQQPVMVPRVVFGLPW